MSTRVKILEVLARHPQGITKDELRRELRLREKTVENSLCMLRIEGSAVWRQFRGYRWWALLEHEHNLIRQHAEAHQEMLVRKRAQNRAYAAECKAMGRSRPTPRKQSAGEAVWQQAPSIWHVAQRMGAQA
jgi:hypothetical protein